MKGYLVKYMERKKEKGYAVICPDGRIANNHIFPTKTEAEKKKRILEAFYVNK